MRKLRTYQKILIVLAAACLSVMATAYIKVLFTVPGELTLIEGEEYICDIDSLFPIDFIADRVDLIKLSPLNTKSASGSLNFNKPVSFIPRKYGKVNLNMKLFGLLPIKTVRIDIVENKQLVACGNTVGVKMKIDGILVIGLSDVETTGGKRVLPARDSGIKPGCFITGINGNPVQNTDDLINKINNSGGKTLNIEFKYGTTRNNAALLPVMAQDDKKYHIGLWVRDSTAGIGTMTFYDPKTGCFGALGHGITDIDTGILMPVESGEVIESSILGIKAGKSGSPGELKGLFLEDAKLGTIVKNSESGIYGRLSSVAAARLTGKTYPIGLRSEIHEGPATILSNIDGRTISEFRIDIQKVSRQNVNGSKGMIIKITDRKLLEDTGGIVQGMSGSPILQNGKIIGAVTHVLVNDPTKGYGIFIEGMLKNLSDMGLRNLEKAG